MNRPMAHRGYLAAGAAAIIATTAGCSALLGAPGNDRPAAPPVPHTEQIAPSLLVAVTAGGGLGRLVGQVVAATARPREDLDVLEAAGRGRAIVTSTSPAPVTVVAPGKPAPPGSGASSYQQAQYRTTLAGWRRRVAADERDMSSRTKTRTAAWVDRLRLRSVMTGPPSGPTAARLGRECTLAASAVTGLVDQAGGQFGTRRVLLIAAASLRGMPPLDELDGDDVIVLTSYLPEAGVANGTQANLLAAGATRAAVLGQEISPLRVERLVAEGLTQNTITESLSGRALFANNSARLLPSAAAVLAPLVAPLRRRGAVGTVNGYASAPGSASHNRTLSRHRADAVASYLEARGVPASELSVNGNGAADLIAPGPSGENRRVVVVIEAPEAPGS